MYLVYLDESGNAGNNLAHSQQPLFVLCALLVPDDRWARIESDLFTVIEQLYPPPRPADFELHANELINPRGFFRSSSIKARLALYESCLNVARQHGLRVIYRSIVKKRYQRWLEQTFGSGVVINPHVTALPLVAQVVNDYLKQLPGSPLGIFISDENKDVVKDVEKALKVLRGTPGRLHLTQIIEKGFFIDSRKSLLLQLCDLCAFAIRQYEEQKAALPVKLLNQACIPWVQPLIHRGPEAFPEVLAWLEAQQKKERPGT